MEECSSDFVDKLDTEYSSGVAKITINNRVSVTKSERSVLASVILVIALLRKRVQKADCISKRKRKMLHLCYDP